MATTAIGYILIGRPLDDLVFVTFIPKDNVIRGHLVR